MRILIVHQYFNTPETGGPLRSYYLAQGLQSGGHEVEIITAHNQATSEVKTIDGITVHYLPVFYENRLGFLRRLMAFLKFAVLAYSKALQLPTADLCYAMSTPLTVGWVAKRLKQVKGVPFIFEVGDLWPEAPVQMGVIKFSPLISWLRKFEQSIYQGAESIVALSPGIKEGILRSNPESKVSVIPNMSDCKFYQRELKNPVWENSLGVTGKTVVTYFGAAGRANHLEYYIEAAKAASKICTDLHFLVVAAGSELSRLKVMAASYKLNNIEFLPYCKRDNLKKILNVTDIVYVSYADVPILSTGSPNKYFDALAAGKLMLVNFNGWLRDITEKHELGYYVDPKRPEMLVEKLTPLMTTPELLIKSQKNARMIAETFFSRGLATQKLLGMVGHDHSDISKVPEAYILTA